MPLYITTISEKSILLWPCREMRRVVPQDVFMTFTFKLLQSFSTSSHNPSRQICPQKKLLKTQQDENSRYWQDFKMQFSLVISQIH